MEELQKQIKTNILVLDGAMGTMVQRYRLKEEDYRGTRFTEHPVNIKGNNDILVLTRPEVIQEIHRAYLDAGADIIETDTFNANRISLADYKMEELAYEINVAAAKLAKKAIGEATGTDTTRKAWVAGSIGPTNKTASLSPDVQNPAYRAVTFDELYEAYREQAKGLIDGGADLIIVETIFDTLNAKAALMAVFDECSVNRQVPVMASVTISDNSGRTLSGQTLQAFIYSVIHFDLFALGLNCSLGARELRPYLEELSEISPFPTVVYPNAGLPNQFGEYDQSPAEMALLIREFAESGFINLVGGCCGTTPDHIRQFSGMIKGIAPRQVPMREHGLKLSGLEPLAVFKGSNFINIGERTNVSGSRKFARLIKEEKYEDALSVARQQVESGAQIIDISMDEAMLDAEKAMVSFLNMIASDPDVARVPVMLDSSKLEVLHAGLKCVQGKAIVNSISLKEGEEIFLDHARLLKKFGAAVIVMAFDEQGQATTLERRIAICKRAFDLLTGTIGFSPDDIIFDPNILTIATGIEEHNSYAVDYLNCVRWIRQNLPYVRVSGGISNLSFSFRGQDALREAMHAVFLYHAVHAGLDMGIVNAGALPVYEEIPPDLLLLLEDVILNRRKDATERLLAFAEKAHFDEKKVEKEAQWRTLSVEERLRHALIKGNADHVDEDIDEALATAPSALGIIEGPLMEGMNQVGDLFGSGKMFLPQVVKSARVMKKAVARLTPRLEAEKAMSDTGSRNNGKVLLATVKGDVHDIGKNIVGVVLACNNFEVIDLGVMVPAERILSEAISQSADIIGLSGLITPSLEEMVHVAKEMQRLHFKLPLLIGGATTSELHTAMRIEPYYHHPVVHVRDASRAAGVITSLLSAETTQGFSANIRSKYAGIRDAYTGKDEYTYISLAEARTNRFDPLQGGYVPSSSAFLGIKEFSDYSLEELRSYIDWTFFFHAWKMNGKYPAILTDPVKGEEARKLFQDANQLLDEIIRRNILTAKGVMGIFPACSIGDDIEVYSDVTRDSVLATFRFLRNQQQKENGVPNLCLSDFVAPGESGMPDYLGLFAVTAGIGADEQALLFEKELDDYQGIMVKILADRLAEAFAERLHEMVRKTYWGYVSTEDLDVPSMIRESYTGIRPAPGYPACPEHSEKEVLFTLLDVPVRTGIRLTENYAMYPGASVCGYYFAHPESRYFNLGKIGLDQITDYAQRKKLTVPQAEKLLSIHLNYRP